MTKASELITVGLFLIGFLMLGLSKFKVEDKNEKLVTKLSSQEKKIKELEKFLKGKSIIADVNKFDILGLPNSLSQHYALIYAQIDLLARLANIPDEEFEWIRNFMRKGLLHQYINEIILYGIDKDTTPETIATQLTISIDWEKAKLYVYNPIKTSFKHININNQAIMHLADLFSKTVAKEKLTIDTSIQIIKNPSDEALQMLNIQKKSSSNKLDSIIMKKLHLVNGSKIAFRKGDSTDIMIGSDYTPEISVKFKYIEKNIEK